MYERTGHEVPIVPCLITFRALKGNQLYQFGPWPFLIESFEQRHEYQPSRARAAALEELRYYDPLDPRGFERFRCQFEGARRKSSELYHKRDGTCMFLHPGSRTRSNSFRCARR